jgi:hypothetical protein
MLAAFDAAAGAWERIGDPYLRAVALLSAAERALAAGDRDRAAERLRHAAGLANQLGARPLLAQIEAHRLHLLTRLRCPRRVEAEPGRDPRRGRGQARAVAGDQ